MQKKILIMGGSGFIGSAIAESLVSQGWTIHILTRQTSTQALTTSFPCLHFTWEKNEIPSAALKDVSSVINLVGQPIPHRRWSPAYKEEILHSRMKSVAALKRALLRENVKPEVIIQASAIGFYGFEDRQVTESSAAGNGFLSEICQFWEKEAQELAASTRLCIARIGVVLGWGGGAFPQLHDIYGSGLGAILGSGRQWMNWIHIEDVVSFFNKALVEVSYQGVFNLVSPEAVTNKEFHSELVKYTASLYQLRVPGLALRIALGQRSSLVLQGPLVKPQMLSTLGFQFQFPTLKACLEHLFSISVNTRAHVLEYRQWLPASPKKLWEFIATAENLERITPPWLHFKVLRSSTTTLGQGSTIDYELKLHRFPFKWRSVISHWQPISCFVDEQILGPYKSWHHKHLFLPVGDGTLVVDRVEYRLPVFPLGELGLPFVKRDLRKIFAFRRGKIASLMTSESLKE